MRKQSKHAPKSSGLAPGYGGRGISYPPRLIPLRIRHRPVRAPPLRMADPPPPVLSCSPARLAPSSSLFAVRSPDCPCLALATQMRIIEAHADFFSIIHPPPSADRARAPPGARRRRPAASPRVYVSRCRSRGPRRHSVSDDPGHHRGCSDTERADLGETTLTVCISCTCACTHTHRNGPHTPHPHRASHTPWRNTWR